MSPRPQPLRAALRMGALVTSLALAGLFVAYRVSSASKAREADPTPAAVSPTAGAPPAPVSDAAKPGDAAEEEEYFPGSKSMIGLGPRKPVKPTRPAPAPTPPTQAPAK